MERWIVSYRLTNIVARYLITHKRKLSSVPENSQFCSETTPKRINFIMSKYGLNKYLEIGVERGHTLEAIKADIRCGVDPKPMFDFTHLPVGTSFYKLTSKEFFAKNMKDSFEMIFVDGLHESLQAYNDVINSFKILEVDGFILLDDIWPSDKPSAASTKKEATKEKRKNSIIHNRWYGDVFKVLKIIDRFHPEIKVKVIGDGSDSHSQALLWLDKSLTKPEQNQDAIKFSKSITYEEIFESSELQSPWKEYVPEKLFLGH